MNDKQRIFQAIEKAGGRIEFDEARFFFGCFFQILSKGGDIAAYGRTNSKEEAYTEIEKQLPEIIERLKTKEL